ncbi:MAG: FtsB family cell division protein [Chitinophagales bacterium]
MKRILKYIENMPWWIKNIYFLISFSFIVWMVFFDRNNSFATYKINKSLKTLENQREYYRTEIEKVNELKEELFSTDEKKEKFAREKYFMKKGNEDIFVIVAKEK